MGAVMGFLSSIAGIVTAGPMGWIVLAIIAAAGIGLWIWWQFKKNAMAYKESQKKASDAQGAVVDHNQKPSEDWKDAEDAINAERDKRKKPVSGD